MPAQGDTPTHSDAGLQPERTDLAWGRTTMSMVVAAAIFLRWMPHHGWFAGTLVAAAVLTALAINLTRRRRLRRAIRGIQQDVMAPDIASTAAVAASVVLLAVLGIYTVLFLPLE
jgi:uncharacterized membrane protein YidH (DUF202 family)